MTHHLLPGVAHTAGIWHDRAMAITDQVILITGGARGIGLETAKALAGRGAKLVLTDLDSPALEEAVAAIGADTCEGIVADVTDLAAMEAARNRSRELAEGS